MVAESAVCLLNFLPMLRGGLWTTAPAMGKKLIARLQANGSLSYATEVWATRKGTDDDPSRLQCVASSTKLKGVSVARRKLLKPASAKTWRSRRSPACAPSPRPTSCDSEFGVQMQVEAA